MGSLFIPSKQLKEFIFGEFFRVVEYVDQCKMVHNLQNKGSFFSMLYSGAHCIVKTISSSLYRYHPIPPIKGSE